MAGLHSTSSEAPRRPDESMDLLNTVFKQALDPSYGDETKPRPDGRVKLRSGKSVVILILCGLLLGLALGNTQRGASNAALEREQLIGHIKAAEQKQDELHERVRTLTKENAALEASAAGLSPADQARLAELSMSTGMVAVTGPALRITVDDGADASVKGSRVVDVDLRYAVNGLRLAGAEAIAINGHRLSPRTAIRGAGDAITVDYRSLSRPYTILAIGDRRHLESGFQASAGGRWWKTLQENYGLHLEIADAGTVTLPADPGLSVSKAKPLKK